MVHATVSYEAQLVIEVIAMILKREMRYAEADAATEAKTSIFHAVRCPAISIEGYLNRFVKYSHCTTEQLVLALVYIDKLITSTNHTVTPLTVHRFLISAIVLACKFGSDFFYSNKFYARIGGVSLQEMNSLEREFLYLLDFSLFVEDEDYAAYHNLIYTSVQNVTPECSAMVIDSIGEEPVKDAYAYPQAVPASQAWATGHAVAHGIPCN